MFLSSKLCIFMPQNATCMLSSEVEKLFCMLRRILVSLFYVHKDYIFGQILSENSIFHNDSITLEGTGSRLFHYCWFPLVTAGGRHFIYYSEHSDLKKSSTLVRMRCYSTRVTRVVKSKTLK